MAVTCPSSITRTSNVTRSLETEPEVLTVAVLQLMGGFSAGCGTRRTKIDPVSLLFT